MKKSVNSFLRLWPKLIRICKNWNKLMSTFFTLDIDFCDIWWILQKKNPRSKIRWENLWNIFFLIFHVFFCLILYHPCFYSSLSDKKQRNGSIYKTNSILVNFAKILPKISKLWGKSHFRIHFWQILPISQKFWKGCHFFVFYRSESCKKQDHRGLNRKKHGISRRIDFIDFLIFFCFADFFLENPSNVTKINVKCEKGAH